MTTPSPAVSNTAIDLNAYCSDPTKFAKEPEYVRSYYDNLCKLVEQMKTDPSSGAAGRAFESLGDVLIQLPYMLTIGLFTDPGNLAMFALTDALGMTKDFWGKNAAAVCQRAGQYMSTWGYNWVNRTMSKILPAGIRGAIRFPLASRFMVNSAALARAMMRAINVTINITTGIIRTSVRGFLALVGSRMFSAAMGAIASFMARLNTVFMVQMVVQFISMMVDSADPCDLNKAMDAEMVQQYANSMNQNFKEQLIGTETAYVTPDNELHFVKNWPIDVRVERLFPSHSRNRTDNDTVDAARMEEFGLTKERDLELQDIQVEYMLLYLMNRKYDAYGKPLLELPEDTNMPDLTPQMMTSMEGYFVNMFASNNVVVGRWLTRYAPLILVGIFAVLFMMFKFV
jgi:hypothetical protein